MIELFFWVSILGISWNHFFYNLFLYIASNFMSKDSYENEQEYEPKISIIIPAYNEEGMIKQRIENCLALTYPPDKIEVIVGSDGSTDKTVHIVNQFRDPRVRILDFPLNRGRSQVHNDCVKHAEGEILFFTDADTRYESDCIRKMVRHYAKPHVGGVGGEIIFTHNKRGSMTDGHTLYWRLEYLLRNSQSKLGILTKVSGANMSVRKVLYQPVPPLMDIDQVLSYAMIRQGYKVLHEPQAVVYDRHPSSFQGELSARQRFAIRALTALFHNRDLLNPFKYPVVAINLFFYRVMRYFAPFLMVTLFVTNIFLLNSVLYQLFFIGQLIFYMAVVVGYVLESRSVRLKVFSLPLNFFWMNWGVFRGVLSFCAGQRITSYVPLRSATINSDDSVNVIQ